MIKMNNVFSWYGAFFPGFLLDVHKFKLAFHNYLGCSYRPEKNYYKSIQGYPHHRTRNNV